MKKARGIIATTNPSSNGDMFTKELLESFVEQAKGLPVTLNFNHDHILGSVESARLSERGVEVEVQLFQNSLPLERLFTVIGGVIEESHQEGDITVYDKIKLTSIGVTATPADTSLTPMREVDQKGE